MWVQCRNVEKKENIWCIDWARKNILTNTTRSKHIRIVDVYASFIKRVG